MFAPTFSMNVLLKDFLDIPIKSCVAFSSQVRKTLIEVLYMPSGEEMKDAYQRFLFNSTFYYENKMVQ